jgi:hypothetical protein
LYLTIQDILLLDPIVFAIHSKGDSGFDDVYDVSRSGQNATYEVIPSGNISDF